GEPLFGLALELRLADKHGKENARGDHHIIGDEVFRPLVAGEIRIRLERAREGLLHRILMRPPLPGRHGVAIRTDEAVTGEPANCPFNRTMPLRSCHLASKYLVRNALTTLKLNLKEILQATGKSKNFLLRSFVVGAKVVRRANPADLYTAEQI